MCGISAKGSYGTIITNSPAIALALCEYKNIKINLIGGKLDPVTRIIKGTSSIKQIEAMNIECCILGVSSLSPENGITFPSFGEAELKKELIARSSQIIVIANKEKLGVSQPSLPLIFLRLIYWSLTKQMKGSLSPIPSAVLRS
ncbi:MAG: hypothetical protein ACLRL6_03545 [Clostridium sp.]